MTENEGLSVCTTENEARRMTRGRVLRLLPKTECSEWFVLGLGFAGLWVYAYKTFEGREWCVSVHPVEPGMSAVASSAPTVFYGKTVRSALGEMARTYGGMLSKGDMYMELYGNNIGDVSVARFPETLSELKMKMELRGWNLDEWRRARRKRKLP